VSDSAKELAIAPDQDRNVAGFWQGLWHGFSAPFTFLISLSNESVSVYEAHNNGGWYNFGYIFGLMMIFGGSKSSRERKHGTNT